jgi:hypothetical protein
MKIKNENASVTIWLRVCGRSTQFMKWFLEKESRTPSFSHQTATIFFNTHTLSHGHIIHKAHEELFCVLHELSLVRILDFLHMHELAKFVKIRLALHPEKRANR